MDSKKSKRKPANKKTSSKSNKKKSNISKQQCSEVWGIIWIAISLLTILSIYVIDSSPLKRTASFLFGMFGVFSYVMPIVLLYIGVLCFVPDKLRFEKGIYIGLICLVFLILAIIDVNSVDIEHSFKQYVKVNYESAAKTGGLGGAAAAVIAYPLVKYCTKAGADIILAAAVIITLIITFKLSIAGIVKKIYSKYPKDKIGIKALKEKFAERKALSDNDDYNYDDGCEDDYNEEYEDDNYTADNTDEERSVESYSDHSEEIDEADDIDSDLNSLSHDEDCEEQYNVTDEYDYEVSVGNGRIREDDIAAATVQVDDDGLSDDSFSVQVEYQRPPFSLLHEPDTENNASEEEVRSQGKVLVGALADFGVDVSIGHIAVGPTITRFELKLAKGVKIKSITNLTSDIALALAAESVRIEAPIPGKKAVGVEVPNPIPRYVYLREILESKEFAESKSLLTIAIGKDIVGQSIVADISKMPHLMIAGTTGSGKSVCMNSIILSIAYKASPDDVRMILIDPKIVEFGIYANLPHLLIPVVNDTKKAASALKWALGEMTRRYSLYAKRNVRNIAEFNSSLEENEQRMTRIVIIIDELAELMMSSAKEVEEYITRIAQLGRACGIHLIVATQRPSVDIITGKIKANIVSRIAFAVSDAINSKVILDTTGAECLIGNGDMLFHPLGLAKARRVQCAFVSSQEVEAVMKFMIERNGLPIFDETIDALIAAGITADVEIEEEVELDSVFIDAGRLIIDSQRPSISYIQQKLRLGYNRAARIMNSLENYGVVSTIDPVKKERKVTMSRAEFDARFAGEANRNDEV